MERLQLALFILEEFIELLRAHRVDLGAQLRELWSMAVPRGPYERGLRGPDHLGGVWRCGSPRVSRLEVLQPSS